MVGVRGAGRGEANARFEVPYQEHADARFRAQDAGPVAGREHVIVGK
jgi:hypothetical protein